ncbi:MAG: response regulator [Phycisphaerales bacterium]
MSMNSVRSIHFLLVEDDDDHADLIERGLREGKTQGTISRVADGEAAMAFLRREGPYRGAARPDVVLLDINLPRMNGHEVLRAIKSDPSLGTIPVVILTTSQAQVDRARAYEERANSYLAKPIDFDNFHQMIVDTRLYWTDWNQPAA